jgi:hypothetical protein
MHCGNGYYFHRLLFRVIRAGLPTRTVFVSSGVFFVMTADIPTIHFEGIVTRW